MSKSVTVNFRVEEEDRAFLDKAAHAASVEKPSVLMRAVVRALKTMSNDEIRALVARGADAK